MPNELEIVLRMVDAGDFCSLVLLIVILNAVGAKMAGSRPDLRAWSIRVCAGAFVAYCIYGYLRLHPETADDWIGITLRGLLAAGLVHGVVSIGFAVCGFLAQHLVAPLVAKLRLRASETRSCRTDQRRSDTAQLSPVQQEAVRRERERAEARAIAEQQQKAADDLRRQAARLHCELLWAAYAPAIQSQFSRDDLRGFFDRYMTDTQTVEFVEQSAAALKTTFETLYRNADPSRQFGSIQEVIERFAEAERSLAAEPFDDSRMATYLKLELGKMRDRHIEAVIKNFGKPS